MLKSNGPKPKATNTTETWCRKTIGCLEVRTETEQHLPKKGKLKSRNQLSHIFFLFWQTKEAIVACVDNLFN